MSKTTIAIYIDEEVLRKTDVKRKEENRNRSNYFENLAIRDTKELR